MTSARRRGRRWTSPGWAEPPAAEEPPAASSTRPSGSHAKGSDSRGPGSADSPAAIAEQERKTKLRKRAIDLVARAAHDTTPEEEARTSAVAAARLIHKENLLEPTASAAGASEAPPSAFSGDQAEWWRMRADHLHKQFQLHGSAVRHALRTGRLGMAEKKGRCPLCGYVYAVAEMIVWRRRRADAIHYECFVRELKQHGVL